MFERYTESARRVIFFARYEASQFGASHIEPEHLLLGFMREDKSLKYVLHRLEDAENIRSAIQSNCLRREKISTSVDLPLSPESKRALESAAEHADLCSDRSINTGHLLLGLLSQKSLAAELLTQSGLTAERILQGLKEHVFDRDRAPEVTPFAKPTILELAGGHLSSARKLRRATPMFERYNENARRAVFCARYEAGRLGLSRIEPEHLLLGLMREDNVVLSALLKPEDARNIRSTIESSYKGQKPAPSGEDLPLSQECKKMLDNAAKQAYRLSHNHIGSEHLLLGLLSQKSLAAELLLQCGITGERVLMCLRKPPAAERPKPRHSSSLPWAWPDAT